MGHQDFQLFVSRSTTKTLGDDFYYEYDSSKYGFEKLKQIKQEAEQNVLHLKQEKIFKKNSF